jgi:hypothetical protein
MRLMTVLLLTLSLAACADDPKPQQPLLIDDEPDLISDAGVDLDVAPDMAPDLALDLADAPDQDAPDAQADMPATRACPTGVTWSQGLALGGVARDHHATFITTRGGPQLHVVGGNNYISVLADHWVAPIMEDGSLGLWTQGASLPAHAAGQGVAQVGDEVFLLGGRTAAAISPLVYRAIMDEAGEITGWEEATPLPQGRFHNSAAVHGRAIYVSGGLQSDGLAQPSLYRAEVQPDGTLGEWTTLELSAARSHHSSFVYDDHLYLLLGLEGNPFNNRDTNKLDVVRAPLTAQGVGTWETVSTADRGLTAHTTTTLGDCALTLAGQTVTPAGLLTFHDEVQTLALDAPGAWGQTSGALTTARSHVHQAPHHNGFLYVVGGSEGHRLVVKSVEIGRIDW